MPWKEGHDKLTSNYNTCVTRLKGQVRKLKNNPTLLNEYDAIMKQQLESGVIEKVAELESTGKIHYLLHLAVIPQDAVTTKLRIVYDASAKGDNGKGAPLNDCLHVDPSLNPLLFDIPLKLRNVLGHGGVIGAKFSSSERPNQKTNYTYRQTKFFFLELDEIFPKETFLYSKPWDQRIGKSRGR